MNKLALAGFALAVLSAVPAHATVDEYKTTHLLGDKWTELVIPSLNPHDALDSRFDRNTVRDLIEHKVEIWVDTHPVLPRGLQSSLSDGPKLPSPGAMVPEPATWLLMILGFTGLALRLRARRRAAA